MATDKESIKVKPKDDVTLAPESGEPAETSSRARPEHVQHGMKVQSIKPGEPTQGEDRESGQVDPE